ncbi:MAG: glycolate oxidase subunit GlcF [Anaerolineae bacterium]|nr:glycolate oxidase subunit GlcF [Anaerolineae bacterium]
METHIPLSELDKPAVSIMNDVIKTCVHCGFCLPTCPTYLETGSELDSPRGRIYLMKGVLEGTLKMDDEVVEHVDRCLGCLACVTACPSGVQYNELIDNFRPKLEVEYARAPMDRISRLMLRQVLPYATRFRLAVLAGRLGKPFSGIMPKPMRAMLSLLPQGSLPPAEPLPEIIPAQGTRRARVALLSGCVQTVLAPEINAATVRVLTRNGVEVLIPRNQGCCGALPLHMGERQSGRAFARRNLNAFPTDVDAIITNAAGCGSALKDYAHLFDGEPEEERAHQFAAQSQDVSKFLAELGLSEQPQSLGRKLRVAYHDACHLGHAQGVRSQPRQLLMSIPDLELVDIPEAEICCGSAGVYNITQPEMATDLLERKVNNIGSTRADGVATGNIGCLTQIRRGLKQKGNMWAVHTMQLLDWAYQGKFPIE